MAVIFSGIDTHNILVAIISYLVTISLSYAVSFSILVVSVLVGSIAKVFLSIDT